jgi:FkbM family methyltransferase
VGITAKVLKGARLLRSPRFVSAALRHRVAAAVEHLVVIRETAAATLIDVGANKGQFSLAFRSLRPKARIIAFEPLPGEAASFERLFAGDDRVTLHRFAISDTAGRATFHVADRADSSSLLAPGAGQREAFGVGEAGTIEVEVRRLEDCLDPAGLPAPVLLKIDVQGAELQVLRGCRVLDSVDFIYCELSFVDLYEGQPRAEELIVYLAGRGFGLAGVFNQVSTSRFGPTQADFLFKRLVT